MKRKILSFALAIMLITVLLPAPAQAADPSDVTVAITDHVEGTLEAEIDAYMSANGITDYSDITNLIVSGGTIDNTDITFLYGWDISGDTGIVGPGGLYKTIKTVDFSGTSIDFTTPTLPYSYSGGMDQPLPRMADDPNELPDFAFAGWPALTSLKLPNNVTKIDGYVFSECTSLEALYLPSSLASIGACNFLYCSQLRDIYTESATPPAFVISTGLPSWYLFNGVPEGAVLHVPDGSGAAWDQADESADGTLFYYLRIENMAPMINIESTRRLSITSAEIEVDSNEPCSFYYEVVKDGDPAPEIDISGAGEAIDEFGLTLSLTGLEPGAYKFYCKAVDSLGNVSERYEFTIGVYIESLDVFINDHETGNLADEIVSFLASMGVNPPDPEKIKSLTVIGETLNDDDWVTLYYMGYAAQSIDLSGTSASGIPDETFWDTSLKDISLPSGIGSIGARAFKDSENLAHITMPSSVPPIVGEDAFSGLPADAVVYVPVGSAAAYRAVDDGDTTDNLWYGLTIVERDTTAPTITGVTPNGTGASIKGNIAITFDKAMDPAAGTVSLDSGATSLTGGSWSDDHTAYTVPYSGLSYSKKYIVTISGFKDTDLNTMTTDSSHSFTTRSRPSSGGGGGSTAVAYYTITATAGEGGRISPSGSASVTSGGSKTYTIIADEGYEIKDVLVDGVSVGAVSTYIFENVTEAHTIKASFKKTETENPEPETINPFGDVGIGNWYYDSVMYVYEKGLMTGTDDNNFDPGGSMTRGMIVTVLHRLDEATGSNKNTFSDVAPGAWYEQAAAWAAANGVAGGVGNGYFAPGNTLTREQLAVMLYNYAKYKGLDITATDSSILGGYTDANSISAWAIDAMKWAAGAGIIAGDGANLNPQGSATRAEVAAMLQRFIENIIG